MRARQGKLGKKMLLNRTIARQFLKDLINEEPSINKPIKTKIGTFKKMDGN